MDFGEIEREKMESILENASKDHKRIQQAKSDNDLRDRFAGRAMQGFIINRDKFDNKRCDSLVDYAYEIADAMMKARKK